MLGQLKKRGGTPASNRLHDAVATSRPVQRVLKPGKRQNHDLEGQQDTTDLAVSFGPLAGRRSWMPWLSPATRLGQANERRRDRQEPTRLIHESSASRSRAAHPWQPAGPKVSPSGRENRLPQCYRAAERRHSGCHLCGRVWGRLGDGWRRAIIEVPMPRKC